MKDKVLEQLMRAAEMGEGGASALPMLADALADADAGDRVELLTRWALAAKERAAVEDELRKARDSWSGQPGEWLRSRSQSFVVEADVPSRDPPGDLSAGHRERHMRLELLEGLGAAVDFDRWYAVRISRRVDTHQRSPLSSYRDVDRHVLRADVTPLDGGAVRMGG